MEILNIKNLSFTYPLNSFPSVKDISFSINKGEFVVICGATGSGKSTLLKMLKPELTPVGKISGDIFCHSSEIGFVMQKPEQQIVTDKVWHEIAFGLENLGLPSNEISLRCAEISNYFGINDWYEKNTSELSGGQKQLLNLAAVLVMQPEILILDEPTSQLDPIAAAEFITALKRLNNDLSITVIITEHRLEEVVPVADRLIIMENGSIIKDGKPEKIIGELKNRSDILSGMPAASRIYTALEAEENCPLTVRQGREYIENNFNCNVNLLDKQIYKHSEEAAIEFNDVFFRYNRLSADILKGLSLKIYKGEIFCILGGNGSGKTTALSLAAGLLKAYSGDIRIFGKKISKYKNQSLYQNCLAMLPQDVQTVFLKNTVAEELEECRTDISTFPFDMSSLLNKHPYDISGGEQQITALAKILSSNPRILLLDEPTKGLDATSKLNIINIIKELKKREITVLIVTHDVEFAAECADRCALLFNGAIVSADTSDKFFLKNNFYTTAACRISRDYFQNAVTVSDVIDLCLANTRKDSSDD